MTSQQDFTWPRIRSVSNKALQELADCRSGDLRGVGNHGRLDATKGRRVSFLHAFHAFLWCEQLRGRPCEVNSPSTYKARLTWHKGCNASINPLKLPAFR